MYIFRKFLIHRIRISISMVFAVILNIQDCRPHAGLFCEPLNIFVTSSVELNLVYNVDTRRAVVLVIL